MALRMARCTNFGVRAYDRTRRGYIVNDLRRDFDILEQDYIALVLDTFNDKRNGVFFQANGLGAQRDAAITDESSQNGSSHARSPPQACVPRRANMWCNFWSPVRWISLGSSTDTKTLCVH